MNARVITGYEILLFFHVLFAVVWVGGATVVQVYALRATLSGDPAALARFAKDTEWVAMRTFMPASLALVALGFALVADGNWGFDHLWILISLAIFASSFVVGATFLGPESGRIGRLIGERGVEHPEVQARIKRIFVVSRIELLLLIGVVFLMVTKP